MISAKVTARTPITPAEVRDRKQVGRLRKFVRHGESNIYQECLCEYGRMFANRLRRSARESGRSVFNFVSEVLVK